MNRFILSTIFLLSSLSFLFAQKITVFAANNSSPIKDVAVFNDTKTKYGYTNLSGEFSISSFNSDEHLNFQHHGYQLLRLSMKDISDNGYMVFLSYQVFNIDEFVVSANRWEQNKDEIPNKITQIRKPHIEFASPQTAADLLSSSDEIYVQKSQMGGGSPMIRGFATNRILLVVDDVRMNNAIFREGNVQNVISLDPNIIESTEVIFGPGSTIYGSDAIGGVISFNTNKALLSTSKKTNVKVEALGRSSSANKEKTAHIKINIGGKHLAFLSSVTFSSFADLKMGNIHHSEYTRPEFVKHILGKDSVITNSNPNIQVATNYGQYNFTEKLRLQLSEKLNIVLANHLSRTSDVPRYDRLIQYSNEVLKYGDWHYGPQKWMMNTANIMWKPGFKAFDEMKTVFARQDFGESRHHRDIYQSIVSQQYEKLVAWSANIDFKKAINDHLIYYGIEAVSNDIVSTAIDWDSVIDKYKPSASRYPDGDNKYYSLASYTGFKLNISSGIFVNGGARYNYSALHSTIENNSYFNFPFSKIDIENGSFTGSLGMVYMPSKLTHINLNFSTGFRSPNLDDAGKVFDSQPGAVVVPNSDLKPEYAYNLDLGLKKSITKILQFNIVGFITMLDQAMVRRDFNFNGNAFILYNGVSSKVMALVNKGSALLYGTSISLIASPLQAIKIKSNINITKGQDQDNIPLRHVSPLFGSTHIIFENKKFKADFYANYNGELSNDQLAPSEQAKPYIYASDSNGKPYCPAWYSLNLKTSLQLGSYGIVNAGIENILNHRYRGYSSGIVAPGRNLIVSLRLFI